MDIQENVDLNISNFNVLLLDNIMRNPNEISVLITKEKISMSFSF